MYEVLAVVATAALGVIAYSVNKAFERHHELLMLRRQKYPDFVKRLEAVINSLSDDSRNGYRDALVELFLIASPGVVRTVAAFHDHMLLPAALRESEQQQQLLADVYHSMRADCFEMGRWSWTKESLSRPPRPLTREEMKRMLPSWEWSSLEEVDLGEATIEEADLAAGRDGSEQGRPS